jgi:hypothetical protein
VAHATSRQQRRHQPRLGQLQSQCWRERLLGGPRRSEQRCERGREQRDVCLGEERGRRERAVTER